MAIYFTKISHYIVILDYFVRKLRICSHFSPNNLGIYAFHRLIA